MPGDLPKGSRLVVVSDTSMWRWDGLDIGFEPVVREIESIQDIFEEIRWIGFQRSQAVRVNNSRPVRDGNVEFIYLPGVGGKDLLSKLKILIQLPRFIMVIRREILNSDIVYSRGPSIPALISVLISFFDHSRIYWHKYAGNWERAFRFDSYSLQKWLLIRASQTKVVINAIPPSDRSHLLHFPNPCLFAQEIDMGKYAANEKSFTNKLSILFVGRVDEAKGAGLLLRMLDHHHLGDQIEKVIFVGSGELDHYKELANKIDLDIRFEGSKSREELNGYYAASHILFLASFSEGFPKVIAEAGAFGCVPFVTNVSIICEYVNQSNGHIFADNDPEIMFGEFVIELQDREGLKNKSLNILNLADTFSYAHFRSNVKKYILG